MGWAYYLALKLPGRWQLIVNLIEQEESVGDTVNFSFSGHYQGLRLVSAN